MTLQAPAPSQGTISQNSRYATSTSQMPIQTGPFPHFPVQHWCHCRSLAYLDIYVLRWKLLSLPYLSSLRVLNLAIEPLAFAWCCTMADRHWWSLAYQTCQSLIAYTGNGPARPLRGYAMNNFSSGLVSNMPQLQVILFTYFSFPPPPPPPPLTFCPHLLCLSTGKLGLNGRPTFVFKAPLFLLTCPCISAGHTTNHIWYRKWWQRVVWRKVLLSCWDRTSRHKN